MAKENAAVEKKSGAKSGGSKKKKEFRKLKRPTKLGTLSREQIRAGIDVVIARRMASE